jgi:hypothetical protein
MAAQTPPSPIGPAASPETDPNRGEPSVSRESANDEAGLIPNGPGAAAILAAGVGSFALGAFAFVGDASPTVKQAFIVWNPTGPLSGVTLAAIAVWLAAWFLLSLRWSTREVKLQRVNLASFAMLIAGLLLTFPPFADLLQGK